MKKKLLFLSIAFLLSIAAMAQKQRNGETRFSIGAELGITSGTNTATSGFGLGLSLQAEHFYREDVSGTFYLGDISYFGKSIGASTKFKATNIIPLRAGIRYYIGGGFHIGAQLGVGFISGAIPSTTAFAYSPQIGYVFKTNKGKRIDIVLKYDGYSNNGTFSAVGLRAAYVF